jgi:hypothetical protein
MKRAIHARVWIMWKKRYVGLEEVSQWADILFYTWGNIWGIRGKLSTNYPCYPQKNASYPQE